MIEDDPRNGIWDVQMPGELTFFRSFPKNEWMILVTSVQEPDYLYSANKNALADTSSVVPGALPNTAGEVAQTFRSQSEETSAKAKRGSCETTSI